MAQLFTWDNMPMTIVVALIVVSYLSFFSVILA